MRAPAFLLAGLALVQLAAAQGLPPPPPASPPGVLRIWGNPMMAAVVERWIALYTRRHPGIQVETHLTGSDIAMAGLYTGQADVALLGREATEAEAKAFEWIHRYPPLGVEVLTGSASEAGKSPAIAVLVHAGNPLTEVSMAQLAAVFGCQVPRIQAWGQLGVGDEWATRAINLYSPDGESGTGRFFRQRVLAGSNKMAWERLEEFPEPVAGPGHLDTAGRDIVAALSADTAGMALAPSGWATPDVKVLAVSQPGVAAEWPTPEAVGSRRYPLARAVFAYVNRPADGPIDTETEAFLDLVLSAEGQAAAEGTGYLPLPSHPVPASLRSSFLESSVGYGVDARRRTEEFTEEEIAASTWRGAASPYARIAAGLEQSWPLAAGGAMQFRAVADHVAFDRLADSRRTNFDLDAGRRIDLGGSPASLRTGVVYRLRLHNSVLHRQTSLAYAGIDLRGGPRLRVGGTYAIGTVGGPTADDHRRQQDLRLQAEFQPAAPGRLNVRLRYLDEEAPAAQDSRRLVGLVIDYRWQWSGFTGREPGYLILGASGSHTSYQRAMPGEAAARLDAGAGTHVAVGQPVGGNWIFELDASLRHRDSNIESLDRKSGRVQLSAQRLF